eukprot:COSAG01_NODE_6230_length_3778_cov_28.633324_5_plen_115_part_00
MMGASESALETATVTATPTARQHTGFAGTLPIASPHAVLVAMTGAFGVRETIAATPNALRAHIGPSMPTLISLAQAARIARTGSIKTNTITRARPAPCVPRAYTTGRLVLIMEP